jgi:hypothetical protein
MKQETVTLLMTALSEAIGAARQNRLELIALQKALEKQNPSLHESYLQEIENLSRQRSYEQNLSVLADLRTKLLQE